MRVYKSWRMMKVKQKTLLENARDLVNKLNIKHIAFIMDGNRRWAKQHNLPKAIGHQNGRKGFRNIVEYSAKLGVAYITTYAFSTENWNRDQEEVSFLMNLLVESLKNDIRDFHSNNIRVKFIGRKDRLSPKTVDLMHQAESLTENNTALTAQVAIDYGSRTEITSAMKTIATDLINGKLSIEQINEDLISQKLYTAESKDPDLIIRTGGENRLSNYLLWQAAYSELHIVDKFWPDFTADDYCNIILDFANRQRRWGG